MIESDNELTHLANGHPVMVFDGACNLCQGWVKFSLARNSKGNLHYLAAQSPLGQQFLQQHNLPHLQFESFYFVEGGKIYQKSQGYLRMIKHLRAPWPWLRVFGVLPRWFLDPLYDIIATNRYRWFGRSELCLIPDPAQAARFLS